MIIILLYTGIPYEETMLRPELINLAKQNKSKIQYQIDQIATDNGMEVVRLPPYHCHYNPIELTWAFLKGYAARHNVDGKLASVGNLFKAAKVEADNRLQDEQWTVDM